MPMKKTVLTFGLMSGVLSSAMMLATLPFIDSIGFDYGAVVGYTAIVLSFLLVFFGIRSYREQAGGSISFGRAFSVGILITIISCVFYVMTWELIYFKLSPGFADKFTTYLIAKTKASGASEEVLTAKRKELAQFMEMYDKPLFNAAVTFVEPFPIGLIVTAISAAVLRKKPGVTH